VNVLPVFVETRKDSLDFAVNIVKVGDLVLLDGRRVDVTVSDTRNRASRQWVKFCRCCLFFHLVSLVVVVVSFVVVTNKTMLVVGVNG
jgi:hypothetical protein